MTKRIAKLFSFVCVIALLYALSIEVYATNEPEYELSSDAQAIYLYNCDVQRVLYTSGENKTLPVGPTAKIMTGLIACELFENELGKTVTVSSDMLEGVSGNVMGLKAGMTLTLKDLLYGTICGGNNDAAHILAIISDGSVSAFVERMNAYTDKLYMKNTEYSNPTGLDDLPSKTTLLDTAKLALAASKNSLYMEISSAANYKTDGDGITVYNRNALISQFSAQGYINKNARGMIAGSTESGGFSLVTKIEKDDMNYICIVMGAEADDIDIYSYLIANDLVDTYIDRYSMQKIVKANESLGKLDVTLATNDKDGVSVSCAVPEDVYAFLPYGYDLKKISYKCYFHESSLTAPVEKGVCVGGVDIYYGDELVATSPLVTAENVDSNYILSLLTNMKSFFSGRFFIIFILAFVPSLAIYLYLDAVHSRHKKVSTIRQYKRFY